MTNFSLNMLNETRHGQMQSYIGQQKTKNARKQGLVESLQDSLILHDKKKCYT